MQVHIFNCSKQEEEIREAIDHEIQFHKIVTDAAAELEKALQSEQAMKIKVLEALKNTNPQVHEALKVLGLINDSK